MDDLQSAMQESSLADSDGSSSIENGDMEQYEVCTDSLTRRRFQSVLEGLAIKDSMSADEFGLSAGNASCLIRKGVQLKEPGRFASVTVADGRNNFTRMVEVPSSEHVAEIVGRAGCKIKALRQRTGTYIKTPLRGQAPNFVITGRLDGVLMAESEIRESAAHFTHIRSASPSSLTHGLGGMSHGSGNRATIVGAPARLPHAHHPNGQSGNGEYRYSFRFSVQHSVIGLVVGPRGSTIKKVQSETNTFIRTPSRNAPPEFIVQANVEACIQAAVDLIERYICFRTRNPNIPFSWPSDEERQLMNGYKLPVGREADRVRGTDHYPTRAPPPGRSKESQLGIAVDRAISATHSGVFNFSEFGVSQEHPYQPHNGSFLGQPQYHNNFAVGLQNNGGDSGYQSSSGSEVPPLSHFGVTRCQLCCGLCESPVQELVAFPCGHRGFCNLCFMGRVRSTSGSRRICPFCSEEIDHVFIVDDRSANAIASPKPIGPPRRVAKE